MAQPDKWKKHLTRFAQLYKNLMLGHLLANKWATDANQLSVHLLAIVNGAAVERDNEGRTWSYKDEFGVFRTGCSLPVDRLHFTTWQELRSWIAGLDREALSFVVERLRNHPLP